jgi:formate dehydrogenase
MNDQKISSNSASGRRQGRGKGRGRRTTKGRQPVPATVREIRQIIGDGPFRREGLLDTLHLMQDEYGHIAAAHIAALTDITNWPMAEIYEVASFYAHFDIVKEDEPIPSATTVRVCTGLPCQLAGSDSLLGSLFGDARIIPAPCMGRCENAPVAEVGHHHVAPASLELIQNQISGSAPVPQSAFPSIKEFQKNGGLTALLSLREGVWTTENAIEVLRKSDLKGLGGAGFPAARKWELVAAQPAPRHMVINADEGEPGTFKDRFIFEKHSLRFLEGMYLAAMAVGARPITIYLRDEYRDLIPLLEDGIKSFRREISGLPPVEIRRGAGAYICGEESAMLESLEGRRALPRHRPPYAAEVGLFGRPTLIHNVETLYFAAEILDRGADWFQAFGRNGQYGFRHYSVSGRVADPGVKLAPQGITARELVDEYCGGMADGHQFAAYLPGGASGGILPARLADIPLDYGTLEKYGCFIGSAGIIVLSDQDDIRDAALNLMTFFADESCGQCTPCRAGTDKAMRLMRDGNWDASLMNDLCQVMAEGSICGLGQAAPNPIRSVLKYFDPENTAET